MNAVTANVVALAQDSNVGRRHLAVMVTTEVEPRRQCVPTQEPGYRKSGAGGCELPQCRCGEVPKTGFEPARP